MIIILVGLKGSGKSTVMNRVLRKRKDIKHVVVGDYFEKVMKKHGLTRDDAERHVNRGMHVQIQKEAFTTIMKEAKKYMHTIINTHAFLSRKEGYFPGLPDYVLEIVKPDLILVLDYMPEIILQRRLKDLRTSGRKRAAELTVEGVKKEQKIQLKFASKAARIAKCKLKIIKQDKPEKYPFEHADKNAEEVLKLFSQ